MENFIEPLVEFVNHMHPSLSLEIFSNTVHESFLIFSTCPTFEDFERAAHVSKVDCLSEEDEVVEILAMLKEEYLR